ENLELADRHAELLARLAVFDGGRIQLLHAADAFGRERGDRLVGDLLDERKSLAFRADQRVRADLDILEGDFRGAAAIDSRIVAGGNAGRVLVHDEDRDAVTVALAAARARGDDQLLRPGGAQNDGLAAIDDIARAVLLCGGGQVGEIIAALRLGIGEGPDRLAADD